MLAQPLTPPSSLGQGHFKSDPKRYNGPEDVAKDREECQRKAPSQHSESGIRDHLSLLPMIPWRDSCVQVRQHSGASLPPRLDPACVSGGSTSATSLRVELCQEATAAMQWSSPG